MDIYQHLQLLDFPKFTQIWIYTLKINHLATPVHVCTLHSMYVGSYGGNMVVKVINKSFRWVRNYSWNWKLFSCLIYAGPICMPFRPLFMHTTVIAGLEFSKTMSRYNSQPATFDYDKKTWFKSKGIIVLPPNWPWTLKKHCSFFFWTTTSEWQRFCLRRGNQGDQICLWQIAQNVSQSISGQN
jgi:hypothetical protein